MNKASIALDIFSGRPNPTWTVDLRLAHQLYQEALRLPEGEEKKPFEGLGYKGFVLTIDQDGEERIRCTVFARQVKIEQGGKARCKLDRDRRLEQRLLQDARAHVDGPLFGTVERMIGEAGH